MKHFTIGIFVNREDAEKAINMVHNACGVPNDDISYVYRNTDGEVKEVSAGNIATDTPAEGASRGAVAGAAVGALAGIAAVMGVIPIAGPLFAGGTLAVALGLTGAVGTAAAGAVTGAVAGGLIGALANMGVGEERAQRYADRVNAGDVLVAVHAENSEAVRQAFLDSGAIETENYGITV